MNSSGFYVDPFLFCHEALSDGSMKCFVSMSYSALLYPHRALCYTLMKYCVGVHKKSVSHQEQPALCS